MCHMALWPTEHYQKSNPSSTWWLCCVRGVQWRQCANIVGPESRQVITFKIGHRRRRRKKSCWQPYFSPIFFIRNEGTKTFRRMWEFLVLPLTLKRLESAQVPWLRIFQFILERTSRRIWMTQYRHHYRHHIDQPHPWQPSLLILLLWKIVSGIYIYIYNSKSSQNIYVFRICRRPVVLVFPATCCARLGFNGPSFGSASTFCFSNRIFSYIRN